MSAKTEHEHEAYLPSGLPPLEDPQTALPAIAKDPLLIQEIELSLRRIPTVHILNVGDARDMRLPAESVHLVLTSPPYWTLKEYHDHEGQLGHFPNYEEFLEELDKVWEKCYKILLKL